MAEDNRSQRHNNSRRLSPSARLGLAASLALGLAAGALYNTGDSGVSRFPDKASVPDKVPVPPVMGGPNITVGSPQSGSETPNTWLSKESAEALNGSLRERAVSLATKIVDRYNRSDNNTNRRIAQRTDEPGVYDVNMQISTGVLVSNDGPGYGVFSLSATMNKNEAGELDPKTVRELYIGENVRPDKSLDYSDTDGVYGFEYIDMNINGGDGVRLVGHDQNGEVTWDSTESDAYSGQTILRPLNPERSQVLLDQAEKVLDIAFTDPR